MWFFVMRVVSSTQDKKLQAPTEAFVSCWIKDLVRDSALEKAISLINAHGWVVATIVEDYQISREDYLLKPDGLQYYEQALIDGEVAVFFVPKSTSNTEQSKE